MTNARTAQERTRAVIAEVLRVAPEKLMPESRLREDLGADSLDLITLMMAFEDEFKRPISDTDAEAMMTVGDAAAYIEKACRSS